MKKAINEKQIVSIKLYLESENNDFEYVNKPEKRYLFGLFKRKEKIGLYDFAFFSRRKDVFYSIPHFEEKYGDHLFIADGKVFNKANIIIAMSNGERYCRYYISDSEAEKAYNQYKEREPRDRMAEI